MELKSNKTIICSVFFLDIVEYSKQSVSGQISLKERFNAFLSIAIRDVPIADRIILDTGDGAAISFLGDIEDALQAALSMRSSLLGEGVRMEPALLVRMGVNLGPVRLVRDINGQPNIVGDGINVSQRVMGFADPGQILVSRSYYDAVSRLSQEYAGMFHYQGSRTDKHVREHEVYAIGYPGDFTSTQRSLAIKQELASSTGWNLVTANAKNYWNDFIRQVAAWERAVIEQFWRASVLQRSAVLMGAAVVMLATLFGIYKIAHKPIPPLVTPVVAVKPVVTPQVAVSAPIIASSVTSTAVIPENVKKPTVEVDAKVQGVKKSSRVRTLEQTTGGPAVVTLVIKPWGEVFLDEQAQGASPPLLELQVVPGTHKLEIRNSSFATYKEVIKAKAGQKIKITHSFK